MDFQKRKLPKSLPGRTVWFLQQKNPMTPRWSLSLITNFLVHLGATIRFHRLVNMKLKPGIIVCFMCLFWWLLGGAQRVFHLTLVIKHFGCWWSLHRKCSYSVVKSFRSFRSEDNLLQPREQNLKAWGHFFWVVRQQCVRTPKAQDILYVVALWYLPNGKHVSSWCPTLEGSSYPLTKRRDWNPV